jgi:hypothetical protein
MYRHMREFCKEKDKQTEDQEIKEQMKQLIQENKDLKQRMTKMEKSVKTSSKSSAETNINNGTININNDNRQVTNNITIVAYGKEDMSHIDREDIIKALKTGFNSTKHLTEVVHFNPKYPKYSNIKRSNFNMKNKLMYHNGNDWITTTNPHMIDDLYNRKRDFIEENMDEYYDSLTKGDMTRLQRWLNVEDHDQRISNIKDELRELLFNKKEVSEQNEQTTTDIETDFTNSSSTTTIEELEELDDKSCDTYILIKASNVHTIKKKNNKKKIKSAPRNGKYKKNVRIKRSK